MPARDWWMILYLSTLCTAIGYAVWFAVIKVTDVNITAMTIFAQPIAGVADSGIMAARTVALGPMLGQRGDRGGINPWFIPAN